MRIIIGLYEESSASKVFCCVRTIYGQKHVTQGVRGQGFAELNFCYRRIFPPEVNSPPPPVAGCSKTRKLLPLHVTRWTKKKMSPWRLMVQNVFCDLYCVIIPNIRFMRRFYFRTTSAVP